MTRRSRIRLIGWLTFLAVIAAAALWMMSDRFTPEPSSRPDTVAAGTTRHDDTLPSGPAALDTEIAQSPPPQPDTTHPAPADLHVYPGTTPHDSATRGPLPSYFAADSVHLLIPVAGVRPENLFDTYTDARSEGRVHNAIDIPAPLGTPVLAADDGRILRLFESVQGGTTIYQANPRGDIIYYYAHLDHYADGIAAGRQVRRGDVIAYVGNTGNAGPNNYHLHFAIWLVNDPKRYWDGVTINPYPLLRRAPGVGPGA
jgi:murein DD-endopeptidase MepM/ murein hydrolase activator NlpD